MHSCRWLRAKFTYIAVAGYVNLCPQICLFYSSFYALAIFAVLELSFSLFCIIGLFHRLPLVTRYVTSMNLLYTSLKEFDSEVIDVFVFSYVEPSLEILKRDKSAAKKEWITNKILSLTNKIIIIYFHLQKIQQDVNTTCDI